MANLDKLKKANIDVINYMAVELLEQFQVFTPTEEQIDAAESFILKVICEGKFIFHEKLTPREIDCLYWAAKGKSSKKTASILCISQATIESHRKQIKEKLKCKTMAQAVFQGMRYACLCPA